MFARIRSSIALGGSPRHARYRQLGQLSIRARKSHIRPVDDEAFNLKLKISAPAFPGSDKLFQVDHDRAERSFYELACACTGQEVFHLTEGWMLTLDGATLPELNRTIVISRETDGEPPFFDGASIPVS